ncbi:hypothetical protein OEZ85_011296 [Tetradesmus obliquus]|uniref:L-lactate permease n=1 Tax=Tetradesmus obliquus TaxID=3088 RepID=A0ABY8TPV8_TETOB|nr:hypothetical protein OEZ85_011296 [Tetradesmus obliquus]
MLRAELVTPAPTPWGPAGAMILCLLPIVFLIVVTMVKQLLLPTSVSLPVAAAMLAFIRLAYLSTPTVLVAACVVGGLLEALTPLSIITGAIMLFQTMQHTKCLPWMMGHIKSLSSGHPVAEVFLIGYAFAYMVEGASGFGTPVALAAPMLASLGHAPLNTVACLLIMNTLATQFGAVGTPIWFGFGELELGEANLQLVGLKASILVGGCAFVIAPLAASFLVPFRELLRSALFVVLATASAVAPALLISLFSYEFPSLIGGLASVLLTALLVKFKVGLRPIDPALAAAQQAAVAAAAAETPGAKGSFMQPVTPRRKSDASLSFSFVENVGAVAHPPVATLDFPLTNAPRNYPRHHSFAAQVNEGMLQQELAALNTYHHASTAGEAGEHSGTSKSAAAGAEGDACFDIASAAATCGVDQAKALEEGMQASPAAVAAASATGKDVAANTAAARRPALLERLFSRKTSLPLPAGQSTAAAAAAAAVGSSSKYLDPEDLQLPLRRNPSGTMQLNPLDPAVAVRPRMTAAELLLRTLPIWLTVLVLLLTRIPVLPIKRVLQSTAPSFYWRLGNFGSFGISGSLVLQLRQVLSEPLVNWKYELLYVPFLLPFAFASAITVLVHRRDLEVPWATPFKEAFNRVAGITVATMGALVLVQLIRVGGASSPGYLIGFYASSWLGQGFLAISAVLGALGSFFSGSTTVSNLTFGDIQMIAASTIGAPVTSMLAVQVAGATIGNMICINNILSAKAVMNMNHVGEGEFIRRTAPVALLFLAAAQALGLVFTLGGALPDKPMAVQ